MTAPAPLALVLVAALAAPQFAQQAPPAPRRPNFVFVIIDDTRRDLMNFTAEGKGRNFSPHIDRLAAQSVVMTGQHIVSPTCTPSRFSCLTGRYASRATNEDFLYTSRQAGTTVVTWNTLIVPDDDVTLPKLLQQAGYVTGSVGKHHSIVWGAIEETTTAEDARDPVVAEKLRVNARLQESVLRRCGFDESAATYRGNVNEEYPRGVGVHNMDWITQGALDFIDRHVEEPFFLWFAPTLMHTPHDSKESWDADPLATANGFLDEAPAVQPPRASLPGRVRESGVTNGKLQENLLWLDDSIGALMKRLEERGIDDDTIVIFFNDNGQEGKGSIYQYGTNYPSLIWRKGGFPCGARCGVRVTNLDFAPTILEWAGCTAPDGRLDGKSFVPVLEGRTKLLHDSLFFELGFTRAVIQGHWKYLALRYPPSPETVIDHRPMRRGRGSNEPDPDSPAHLVPRPPFGHVGGNPAEDWNKRYHPAYWDADQLYDLSSDPNETVNLAKSPKHAERLAAMKKLLTEKLAQVPGGFGEFEPPNTAR
jgi:arylsulfatase A-like enzyme